MDTKAATTQIRTQQWTLQKSVLLLTSKGQIRNSRISSSTGNKQRRY